jgi:hypothetical protein
MLHRLHPTPAAAVVPSAHAILQAKGSTRCRLLFISPSSIGHLVTSPLSNSKLYWRSTAHHRLPSSTPSVRHSSAYKMALHRAPPPPPPFCNSNLSVRAPAVLQTKFFSPPSVFTATDPSRHLSAQGELSIRFSAPPACSRTSHDEFPWRVRRPTWPLDHRRPTGIPIHGSCQCTTFSIMKTIHKFILILATLQQAPDF